MLTETFNQKLAKLTSNNTLGSKELLTKLNQLLLLHFKNIKFSKESISNLKSNFLNFNSVITYLEKLEGFIDENNMIGLKTYLEDFDIREQKIYTDICHNLYSFYSKINPKIITISNSLTIQKVLALYNKTSSIAKVFVCESRPNFEGRNLAKSLADEGIKSEIILEANIPKYVNKSDICVIGADIILDNKSIVNKIGSKSLAINCLHFKKPFLVISDSSKFSRNIEFKEKEKPKSEIWAELPASIKCSNKYFEIVEKELITRIITEEAII